MSIASIEKITSGLTGEVVKEYIRDHLPSGWRLCHGPSAQVDLDNAGGVILNVGAEKPNGHTIHAGARVVLSPERAAVVGRDHAGILALAAELGDELRSACERRVTIAPVEIPPTFMRFTLAEGAKAPTRGSKRASGYDLYALTDCYVNPGQPYVIDTGVSVELPTGYEGQVRPRSSMTKRGLWVALGTIDEDYRGPVGVSLINHARDSQRINAGDRIAQFVIAPVFHPVWELVVELGQTERGDRGWGSTGK